MPTKKMIALDARFLAASAARLEARRLRVCACAKRHRLKKKHANAIARAKAARLAKIQGIAAWKNRIAERQLEDSLQLPPRAPDPRRLARELETIDRLVAAPKRVLLEACQLKQAAGRLLALSPSSSDRVSEFEAAARLVVDAESALGMARHHARRTVDSKFAKQQRRASREPTPGGLRKAARTERQERRALRELLERRPAHPAIVPPPIPAQPAAPSLREAREAAMSRFNSRLTEPAAPLPISPRLPPRRERIRLAEEDRSLPPAERAARDEAESAARHAEWKTQVRAIRERLELERQAPGAAPAARGTR